VEPSLPPDSAGYELLRAVSRAETFHRNLGAGRAALEIWP